VERCGLRREKPILNVVDIGRRGDWHRRRPNVSAPAKLRAIKDYDVDVADDDVRSRVDADGGNRLLLRRTTADAALHTTVKRVKSTSDQGTLLSSAAAQRR